MSRPSTMDASTPIPPPPHSAGRRFAGLRSPIDPAHIPSPTDVQEQDQVLWSTTPFYTCSGHQPPLATSDYVAIDQGNSSPRFIRFTADAIPYSSDLASTCEWPLGAVIQPLADLHPEEDPVPLVGISETGPARCQRCQAYVNPFVEWVSGGEKWKCNFCGTSTDVTAAYFSHLDSTGRRADYASRIELQKGTVDFVVPKEYYAAQPRLGLLSLVPDHIPAPPGETMNSQPKQSFMSPILASFLSPSSPSLRQPAPVNYIFAVDTSVPSIRTGFLVSVLGGLRDMLYGNPSETSVRSESMPCFPRDAGCRMAIMTYDSTLHYYDLAPGLQGPRLMVVPDVDDPFVPLHNGLFVDPYESRDSVDALLDMLSHKKAEDATIASATGAMVQAALSIMRETGGHLLVFSGAMVTSGPGSLKPRDASGVYETKAENVIFAPADSFWPNLGEQCAEAGLGIDLFVAPLAEMDLASMGSLCEITGGQMFFHPKFDAAKHGDMLTSEIRHVISRTTCYDSTVRIRCSAGLRVSACLGSFYSLSPLSPSFALLTSSTAFSVQLVHTSSLAPGSTAYIQSATVFTTRNGQRRVRCHNLSIAVKSLVGEYFAKADLGAGICLLSKMAMSYVGRRQLSVIKKDLVDRSIAALLAYRTNCAGASPATQLILPETLKTLPIYTLSLMKSKALKGGTVAADVRCHHRLQLQSMSVSALLTNLYPRLFALHDLEPTALMPGAEGGIFPPEPMRLSYLWMEAGGLYLIDNGEINVIWVGGSIPEVMVRDLFGVESIFDIKEARLPILETLLSRQVRHLVEFLSYRRGRLVPLLIARQNLDAAELEFSNLLHEDENNDGMSYTDFLCQVHDEIKAALKNGKGSWSSSR